MRKCILALVVLCAFWSKGVCAVTITVTGSFNNLEPLTSYNYSVTASGLPPGAGAIEFTWGFVGKDDDANPTYGAGNATVSGVKWKNSSNTDDPKKITIGVWWYVSGVKSGQAGNDIPINVKYIGPIGSMTVNGSSLSNGSILPLSCGSSSVSVTVPSVAREPSNVSVSYTYTFPVGWSPQTVTTTNTTATSTPSAGGGGIVKVEAKRIDGTTKTSIASTITRPTPDILSLNTTEDNFLFCNTSQTRSLSATGNPVSDKFVWTPSGGARVAGSASPQTIPASQSVNISAVNNGEFIVRAYSTACGGITSSSSITRRVKFGPPAISAGGQYLFEPTTNIWFCYIDVVPGAAPSWSLVSGDASFSSSTYSAYVSSVNGGTVAVMLTNTCGNSAETYFNIPPAGSLLTASPNPANDKLRLTFKAAQIKEFLPEEVALYSESSTVPVAKVDVVDIFERKAFVDGNKIEMNVGSLPRGIYYLHFTPQTKSDKKVEKIRIKLE